MSTQVIVDLPDNVYRRAQRLAQLTGRDIADILTTTLELSLPPLMSEIEVNQSLASLSNEEVIARSELQMEVEQDRRLSELLHKQQAGKISEAERIELQALMRVYEMGLLRKSQALAEAVRRGLREPLEP
jgi:hypothetical protein